MKKVLNKFRNKGQRALVVGGRIIIVTAIVAILLTTQRRKPNGEY